ASHLARLSGKMRLAIAKILRDLRHPGWRHAIVHAFPIRIGVEILRALRRKHGLRDSDDRRQAEHDCRLHHDTSCNQAINVMLIRGHRLYWIDSATAAVCAAEST